jgi:hypothetical protein
LAARSTIDPTEWAAALIAASPPWSETRWRQINDALGKTVVTTSQDVDGAGTHAERTAA